MRLHKIHVAARALLDLRSISTEGGKAQHLLVRPKSWAGSGQALVAHGGQLCRYELGSPTLIYGVTLSDLAESWQMLTAEELRAEQAGTRPARRRARESSARGRPSGAAIAQAFPGWLSIAQAAEKIGAHRDRVRRAIKAGLIPSRVERGIMLVEENRLGELMPFRLVETVETPAAVADEEAYS